MAFLDNSGDIILDAVLTDIGRKRMAAGDFKITKFAIGDDEIDYMLYNKNHPSGSAYYDLEILQTPVLEAFTQINANINYGLTSFSQLDLLYLPSIKINNKVAVENLCTISPTTGLIYLIRSFDNDGSGVSIKTHLKTDLTANVENHIMKSLAGPGGRAILIETGIDDTSGPTSTASNQASYILSKGLQDNTFNVSFDKRYIKSAMGPEPDDSFTNQNSDQGANLSYRLTLADHQLANTVIGDYRNASINGILNRVYYNDAGTGAGDSSGDFSTIHGPRSNFTVLALNMNDTMSQNEFIVNGTVGATQGSGASGKTYDFIDTTVYVNGATTNVSIQIPVRIIQLAR